MTSDYTAPGVPATWGADADDGASVALVRVQRQFGMRAQRGMATAEYAVGILAAVALAVVLIKVFNHDSFFKTLLDIIITIVKKIMGLI